MDNEFYLKDIQSWSSEDTTTAEEMLNFLTTNKDNEVNIFINSGGGDVAQALQMYHAMKRHGNVNVYVDGMAASAASFVAFGGKTLKVPESSVIMIHKPSTIAVGNADELRKAAEALDAVQSSIEAIYKANAKGGYISSMVNKETWFSGREFAEVFECELVEDACKPKKKAENFTPLAKRLLEIKDKTPITEIEEEPTTKPKLNLNNAKKWK